VYADRPPAVPPLVLVYTVYTVFSILTKWEEVQRTSFLRHKSYRQNKYLFFDHVQTSTYLQY
jgi:hypothetical protein